MAEKFVVKPFATEDVVGVIDIDVSKAAVTDKFALFELIPFAEAVIVVLPSDKVEAIPLVFIEATATLLEVQVS